MNQFIGMTLIRSRWGLSAKIAAGLGLTRGAVAQWERIPDKYLLRVEKISEIPRELLRPDLFERSEQRCEL